MATIVYTILLAGILVLPLPLWTLLEYRARKKQQQQAFSVLQDAAGRYQMVLTNYREAENGWMAADTRQKILLMVTGDEGYWQTRLLDVKAGCKCHIQRSYRLNSDQNEKPLSVSLCIEPAGEMPAEWLLYHSNTWQPRKCREAEKMAEHWCQTIRQMGAA